MSSTWQQISAFARLSRAARARIRDQWLSAGSLRQLQAERLRQLLVQAGRAPNYAAHLGSISDLRDPFAALARLPVLDRPALMSKPPEDYSIRPLEQMFKMTTSGSSGTPLAVYRTAADEAEFSATWFRVYRAYGCGPFSSEVNIGRNVASMKRGPMRLLREWGILPDLKLVSSFTPVEELARMVAEAQPDVLNGYALSIQMLAERQLHARFLDKAPKVVICAAMEVTAHCLEVAARAFGAPAVNVYVTNDAGVLGWSCPADQGVLHTNDDVVYMEFLDDKGRPVPDGEVGEIVVTPLQLRGMPLLRYRLGDLAARVPGTCKCGRSLGLMTPVQGRSTHVLPTPAGGRVTAAYLATGIVRADAESWVARYQIRERALGHIEVGVVARREPAASEVMRLRDEYVRLLGGVFVVEISLETDIPLAPNGKFQFVIPLSRNA